MFNFLKNKNKEQIKNQTLSFEIELTAATYEIADPMQNY